MSTKQQTAKTPQQEPEQAQGKQQGFVARTARALCSRRFVLVALLGVITAELGTLSVGLVQRLYSLAPPPEVEALRRELDTARQQNLEATRRADQLEKALDQAVGFAGSMYSGSAGIGAAPTNEPSPRQDTVTDHNAPPPLRPADVGSLVYEETGDVVSTPGAPTAEPEEPAQDTPAADTEAGALSQEDAEELDRLIRAGIAALVAGDVRNCILHFEEASLLKDDHPALLYYYGMAFDKLMNPAKAREYYTKVFNMRSKAGKYFERASRRLTYGFDQPSDLRGKLSFGPYTHSHTTDPEVGERVSMRIPILVAPETELSPQDIYIHIQFFVLVNERKIRFSPIDPTVMWENEKQDWSDNEENILVTFNLPPLSREEKDAYGEMTYYGFTAKFMYKGEPIDCISNPSALILHEQILTAREATRKTSAPAAALLPDDGLAPMDDTEYETATPVADDTDTPADTPVEATDDTTTPETDENGDPVTPFSKFIEELDPSE